MNLLNLCDITESKILYCKAVMLSEVHSEEERETLHRELEYYETILQLLFKELES